MCHAYQIVKSHGIPDDHIIVMMADDIAYHEKNPTPGKIINEANIKALLCTSNVNGVLFSPTGRMFTKECPGTTSVITSGRTFS